MTIEAMKAIQMVYANTTKHDWPDDIWDAICQAIEANPQPRREPLEHAWLTYKREWVGLADDEVEELWERTGDYGSFYQAVDDKLKEKNT